MKVSDSNLVQEPLISVIVPVYNTAGYLPQCIDSLLAQTHKNLEIFLVDDGSTDVSGAICDAYAEADARIAVIHKRNGGVSSARNVALELAKGEYIGFVDSDDRIQPDMYSALLEAIAATKCDVVICGMSFLTDKGRYLRSELTDDEAALYQSDMLKALYGTPNPLGGGCCNKLFRSETIDGLRFDESLTMAEDWIFLFEAFQRCSSGMKIGAALYNVVERPNSATRGNEIEALYDIIFGGKSLLLLLLLAKNYSLELEKLAIRKYLDDCIRYGNRIKRLGREGRKPYRFKVARIKFASCKVLFSAAVSRKISFIDFLKNLKMIAFM